MPQMQKTEGLREGTQRASKDFSTRPVGYRLKGPRFHLLSIKQDSVCIKIQICNIGIAHHNCLGPGGHEAVPQG
jgi:hypothetical protein